MKAVILCGGLGERLRPLTLKVPKPLLPLGDKSILEINLLKLKRLGFSNITLSVGYLGTLIQEQFRNGENLGISIDYVYESYPLGTAGSLSLIEEPNGTYLIMNADILHTIPLDEYYLTHTRSSADVTIVSINRKNKIDFGLLDIDLDLNLTNYTEKPETGYDVSTGIYFINSKVFHELSGDREDMPNFITKLLKENYRIKVIKSSHYWKDIGRLDDYENAINDFELNRNKFL